jgi:hypothetical protein
MTIEFGKRSFGGFGFKAVLVLSALSVACSAAETLETNRPLVEQAKAAAEQAKVTNQDYVRFNGGLYDRTTDEVYVDEGGRVMRFEGDQLVDVAGDVQESPKGTVSAMDTCSNTQNLSHCETVTCSSTWFYLNYSGDNFQDPYAQFGYGATVNVRNAPYRRLGARGVRVFYAGLWGYMSGNCLSGGL